MPESLDDIWKRTVQPSLDARGEGGNVYLDDIWKRTVQPAMDAKPSRWWDYVRSIPRGVVKGFMGAAGDLASAELTTNAIRPEDLELAKHTPGAEESAQILEKNVTGPLPKPSGAAGRFGETTGEFLGNPASWMGPGGPVGKAATAVTGALGSEAAGELTKGSKIEGPARIAGAMLGAKAPQVAARVTTPLPIDAKRAADVATVRSGGVEPRAGQVTGRKWLGRLEEMGDYIGGGESYTEANERIAGQVTARVAKAMGEQGDRITPEMLQKADDRIGQMFDHAASRLPINFNGPRHNVGDDMVKIEQDMMNEGLPDATINRIAKQIDTVRKGFITGSKGNIMSGETYRALTTKGSPLSRSIEDSDPNVRYYATRLRSSLDDAAEATAFGRGTRPGAGRRAALEELKTARSQWFHYLVARDAVSRAGEASAEGLITPQRLRSELTSGKDRRMRYALNRSELAEFARAGNVVMPPPRSSGTAERLIGQHVPTLFGLGAGLTGRVVNSGPVQSWLKNQAIPGQPFYGAGTRSLAPGAGSALATPTDDPLQ